ncbi:prolipoprotein diacylglyceryl transferase [Prochlorococcus marinus]|uniref:Phosphatidylglycerol--prolipoprotein diacylglyceryl transferase n=1 Tax=Prochlorococcus marinus (strain MIT 9211) TaxID=93059 RepID=LGT_PROM4|nr:prolipoprotein diacylglyceryl transferase [Prochlorococcus marinus]A9BE82.1 RecName: Full=Phosphatidylglycerol--prolipoprotein diacylglyceryl transferase [Prochlorococcus marinus str. MIT 9211]ABX08392.1 putative prolipoprotein diacylglyceryl transferase [Prochlorococcus marinus str. MIT 9211]
MEAYFATFRSPGPELLKVGFFTLRWYGLLIAFAVLIGLNLSNKLASIKGLSKNLINDLLPILVISSIIGARAYYVIFEWRNYSGSNFWSSIQAFGLTISIPTFIKVWQGGIAIHGALLAGTIAILIFCRLKQEDFWDVLDVLIPSVALGQAIGRWGNFFNNEAFGLPTDLPWKLFIPYPYRPEFFLDNNYFHPTFLYESIWNILLFLCLISLIRLSIKGKLKLPSGSLSCVYAIIYSLGRVWIEGLRTDPLCLGGVPPFCIGGIRIAQLISTILFGLGLLGLFWIYQRKKKLPSLGIIGRKHQ